MNKALSLELLFDFKKENKRYFDELVEQISQNRVVPFIGAGMSIPIYRTWDGFFSNVLNEITIRPSASTEIKRLLVEKEYEKAASLLEKSLGEAGFVDIIKEEFSEKKIVGDALDTMHISILPHVFKSNTVITTNFDRLLNKVFEEVGYPFKDYLTPYESSRVARGDFQQGIVNYLLKLHGDYMHTDKIVFTEEQYNACYGLNLDSEYVSFLSEVLSSRVLLFLGCSLEADRTTKLLQKIALNNHRTHYAIIGMPSDTFDDEFFDKNERLSNMGIKCIWYPKGKHEYVGLMLKKIKENSFSGPSLNPPKVTTVTPVQKPSKDFLGREDEIKSIKEKLRNESKLVLVNGIGGIGKSQICSSMYYGYLDHNAADIQYLGWISYDKDLKSSLFKKVSAIKNITNINDYFDASINYFNGLGNKLLLFIDNANNVSAEEQRLISSLACSVIVTSRNKYFNQSYKTINIDRLSENECIELYLRTLEKADDHNILSEIIKKADRHTVTVVLLAKTQKSARITAYQLLELIKESGFDLSNITENVKHEDEDTVFIEHLKNIFKIVNLSNDEIRLLKLFSLLAYEPLKQDYAKQWFGLENYNEINSLVNKGWLMDNGNGDLSMHPVISSVIRATHKVAFEECEQVVENLANAIFYTPFDNYTEVWIFAPFATSMAEYFMNHTLINITLAKLFFNLGRVLNDQGEYDKALEWYEKALKISKTALGKRNPNIAVIYNNIAVVYNKKGEYDKALEWNEKALKIKRKVLGKVQPYVAATYNNIARVYNNKGEYDKALEWNEKALKIKEKVLGKEHPNTATAYNNIAVVYYSKGEYDKALKWYERALKIVEKVLGKGHPDTAAAYNNIAIVYKNKGEYDKALEQYEKALKIVEMVLGKEHLNTARTYNNIALVYDSKGEYDKALEWNEKALKIYEKVLGKEHPDTAVAYSNIAIVYLSKRGYDEALEWNEKALKIREKVLGKEHPDTAITYNNIAGVYDNKGEYDRALEWYVKAFYTLVRCIGFDHPNTKTVLNNMYDEYIRSGKKQENYENWLKDKL